jgi:hypothetical protein
MGLREQSENYQQQSTVKMPFAAIERELPMTATMTVTERES